MLSLDAEGDVVFELGQEVLDVAFVLVQFDVHALVDVVGLFLELGFGHLAHEVQTVAHVLDVEVHFLNRLVCVFEVSLNGPEHLAF